MYVPHASAVTVIDEVSFQRVNIEFSIKPISQNMPSWSATDSLWTEEMLPVSRKAFGPVLHHPVTKHETVFTAMELRVKFLNSG
jgi:hypothetical protein